MRRYCIDCKMVVEIGESEHAIANCPSCGGFLDAAPEEPVLRKRPRPYVSRIALVDADKLDQLEQHTRNLEALDDEQKSIIADLRQQLAEAAFAAETWRRHEQEAPHSACTCRLCTALRCNKELEQMCTHLEQSKQNGMLDQIVRQHERIEELENTVAHLESDLASEAAQRSALEHMLAQARQQGGSI